MRSLESILRGVERPLPTFDDARAEWLRFRQDNGYVSAASIFGRPDSNAKLAKGDAVIYGLTLLPHEASGVNACPVATEGCARACVLMTAGRGVMSNVRKAREVRTRFAAERPAYFLALVLGEVAKMPDTAIIRLNVASDVRWEYVLPEVFATGRTFYDYTKWNPRNRGDLDNYRIVYSRNERDGDSPAVDYLRDGGNVAVVFSEVPSTWHGFPVVDGDRHDDRTDDGDGVVVALTAKGSAKTDTTGFVVHPNRRLPIAN